MKRTIALILTLTMLLGMLPLAAFATVFTDVKPGEFYAEAVDWAVEKGITTGLTATTFGPMENCTRGHVVTFLWRAVGKPEPGITSHSFTDVEESAYYYRAMLWAVEDGVTTGLTEVTFGPDEPCTRGQVVTFLWRTMGKPEPITTIHSFTDVMEGAFYYKPMLWAVEKGITTGMTATTFVPDGICTRGQVVTFLYRCLKDHGGVTPPADPLEIITQPSDTECAVNDNVTFAVAVHGGAAPYTYQWERGSEGTFFAITEEAAWATGQKTDKLSFQATAEDFANNYTYRCIITDAKGNTVTSNAAGLVEALQPLTVSKQPENVTCALGNTVTFSVEATGGKTPYSYQWQYIHNGIQEWLDITDWGEGNRSDTITITVQTMDAEGGGKYRCVITDAAGKSVTSGEAWVVIPMEITAQPVSAIADYGEKAGFYVDVVGGMEPLAYQWQGTYTDDSDGWSDLGSESWVQGYNDSRFYVTASENLIAENWRFRCVIRDSFGQELITDSVSVLVDYSFGIKKQPENVEIATMGDTITFTVEASGEDLSYHWYSGYYEEGALEFTAEALSSDTYSGINTDTLSFMLTEKTLKPEYFCHIYDSEGNQTGTKSVKVLDVIRTLAIRTQPVNAPVVYSDDTPVTFTVEAVGEGLTYQWYRCYHDEKPEEDAIPNPVNYSHASGAKTNTLTCNAGPIDINDDGYGVYCKITDKYGSVVYTDLVFSNVDAIYFAITYPANVENAKVGDKASFTAATYGGKGPNTYQWQYLEDGVWVNYNSTVGTDVILTITVTEKDFVRKIRCIVTDSLGNQITSKEVIVVPAELTVIAQPEDVHAELEERISFYVEVAGGKETYSYQWQYKARTDTVWKNVSGSTKSTMSFGVQEYRYHSEYRCVITDAEGNQVITRTVRVDPVDLTILTQPVSQTGKKGDILSYTVEVAGGKAPYTYQWYLKAETGQWIETTDSTATCTFEVNMITVTQNYYFYCVITDADGESVTTDTVYFRPA